jgi:glucuronoarabinoxylan endo-1,4-beta-xylanase
VDAFRNGSNAVTLVALNTGTNPDPVTFTIQGTGISNGAVVTPYLTGASSAVAAQAPVRVSGGAFTWTLPARSLVTFQAQ